jgi:hypothetical protein
VFIEMSSPAWRRGMPANGTCEIEEEPMSAIGT